MSDPVFRQSVIMMVPTIEEPLIAGIIVNEPTGTPAHEVFPRVPAFKNDTSSAYFGGPVDNGNPTVAIRTSQPPAKATEVLDGVCVTTDADTIAQILKNRTASSELRVFLGRAQWLKDQLHAEMLVGAWYQVPADADKVFSPDPAHLWHKLVERGQLEEANVDRIFNETRDLRLTLAGGVVWPLP